MPAVVSRIPRISAAWGDRIPSDLAPDPIAEPPKTLADDEFSTLIVADLPGAVGQVKRETPPSPIAQPGTLLRMM